MILMIIIILSYPCVLWTDKRWTLWAAVPTDMTYQTSSASASGQARSTTSTTYYSSVGEVDHHDARRRRGTIPMIKVYQSIRLGIGCRHGSKHEELVSTRDDNDDDNKKEWCKRYRTILQQQQTLSTSAIPSLLWLVVLWTTTKRLLPFKNGSPNQRIVILINGLPRRRIMTMIIRRTTAAVQVQQRRYHPNTNGSRSWNNW